MFAASDPLSAGARTIGGETIGAAMDWPGTCWRIELFSVDDAPGMLDALRRLHTT